MGIAPVVMSGRFLRFKTASKYQNAALVRFIPSVAGGRSDRFPLRNSSLSQFANAIDAAKQWDSDLVEARYIKDVEENLSIVHLRFGENSKPLFRNREFIVYERRERMEDGTLVRTIHTTMA